ncbi:hypothetical protein [Bradyrhizobium liaoningense]|uniref:hypothetical protein n=1 Tax=Bradyrhizobium liaoningense TaxID=43992 RepID=UPI001BA5CB6F|nr:hypothetical protein [Bradyrhizobium liaoningense]MBR0948612.1 hypothetical protein [Bradyrhizobium liaoningense]
MKIDIVHTAFAVIALGVLIAASGFQHFHAPRRVVDIRFSVPQERYFFALLMHVSCIVAIYLGLILFVLAIYTLRGVVSNNPQPIDSQHVVWAALMSAVFVRIAMPHLPVTADILNSLRSLSQRAALFPMARESLVTLLASGSFVARKDANDELNEQLAIYGVTLETVDFLSQSAKRSLLEVCSLRHRLLELFEKSHGPKKKFQDRILDSLNALLAINTHPVEIRELLEKRRLRQFWAARAEIWAQLTSDHQRLFRRSARALLLIEDIHEQVSDQALYLAISSFVSEESEELLSRYRRLIAEVTLSCEPQREIRTDFLKTFGYSTALPIWLPLRPWVIVFALDFLLFLLPMVVGQFADTSSQLKARQLILFASVHAISQTVAITWAIYPKITSNFARPSLYSFPWQSYALYGLASYVSGAIVLFAFRLSVPMPFPILVPTLISSLSFLNMTIGISVLIDRRLQSNLSGLEK